jgi:hypothetical protein
VVQKATAKEVKALKAKAIATEEHDQSLKKKLAELMIQGFIHPYSKNILLQIEALMAMYKLTVSFSNALRCIKYLRTYLAYGC